MDPNQDPGAEGPNNSNIYHPQCSNDILDSTSLKDLDSCEKDRLLQDSGYLFGVRMGIDGPQRAVRAVATRKPGSPPCIVEMNEIIAETVGTKQERDAKYAHHGWSLTAATTIPPWAYYGMTNSNLKPLNREGEWTTKCFMLRRLAFNLPVAKLEPVPDFEVDVREALNKPNDFERFQAFYRVLQLWGDVIPLDFDSGVSLSITDTDARIAQPPDLRYVAIHELLAVHNMRIVRRGGEADPLNVRIGDWLTRVAPATQWCQIRVHKVIPTTDLLNNELREQVNALFSRLLSFSPLSAPQVANGYWSAEDNPKLVRPIAAVTILSDSFVNSLTLTYLDGTQSDLHGGNWGQKHTFSLESGEHITEIIVWSCHEHSIDWIHAIQFITNMGRVSRCYGKWNGKPTVLKSENGVFAGLLSATCTHPEWKDKVLNKIQAIWRHDVIDSTPKQADVFSDYFGGYGGPTFNDRELIGNSPSMCISKLEVNWESYINYICVTYVDNLNGKRIDRGTLKHGEDHGSKTSHFELEPGEHIVTISGRYNGNTITQLCFATNLGRTSDLFGEGGDHAFSAKAPRSRDGKPMRLQYLLGKCGSYLDGIMFAWTPLD